MTSLAADPTDPTLGDAGTVGPLFGQAVAWGRASDISARSALVTILGDTVAPLGGTIWLADVIALAEPFGFSERLVRTSMFRLVAEGWVTSERLGRRSRYSLTDYGQEETRAAEQRIYRPEARPWDGSWTLVFAGDGRPEADELTRHLRWRGFARMADGVHAHPNDEVAETRKLLERLGIEPAPPVAAARFDGDGEAPLPGSGFRAESGLAEAEAAYRRFLDRYGIEGLAQATPSDTPDAAERSPVDAFALRTMLVHDLRRARLRDPDLPTALLPVDWVGHQAVERAATLYRSITGAAWDWVTGITGLTVADESTVAARFATSTTNRPGNEPPHATGPKGTP
ncbi:MAG: PaaX family transcriptional regulator C-terminal domain-containing protein [Actinomycetota bacterium]